MSKPEELIKTYLNELYKWNEKINLTAVKREEIQKRLLKPSLEMLSLLPARGELSIFDIGSGGGIPAIILAVHRPDNRFFLVESNGKKATFLNNVVAKLELENILVINERTEKMGDKPEFIGSADVVTSRQVAPDIVFASAEFLLNEGGKVIIHRPDFADYHYDGFEKEKSIKSADLFIKTA